MILVRVLFSFFNILWVSLIIVSGCSVKAVPQASTDELIQGAFELTTEWKTITLSKPLDTLPHSQRLEVLLNIDKHEPIHEVEENEFHIIGSSYKRKDNDIVIRLDVILIDDKGREFKSTMKSTGFRKTKLGTYYFLGYGTNSDKGKFHFPKNVKFSKIKIKSNVKIKAEHLYWVAPQYYQAPNYKWSDILSSEIVKLD